MLLFWGAGIVLCAGVAISTALLLRSMVASELISTTPQPVVETTLKKAPLSRIPIRLLIPNIDVDARVVGAGIGSDGAMDIKENPDEVAWYNLGPRPGDEGAAVIAGHYGWKNGHGSIFNDLHTLRVGDTLSTKSKTGAVASFIVKSSKVYDPGDDASEIFKSHDGKAHLNLVTCEGAWVDAKQSYSRRLVVFTDKQNR